MANTVTMTQMACATAATFTSNVAADDTVVIGDKTYTFKAAPSAAYEVDVGTDLETSIANLVAAINLSGTAGTEYGASHVEAHPAVTATGSATVLSLAGRGPGAEANGLYLAATSPGANDISVGGASVAIAIAADAGTSGVGSMDAFITSLFALNQINSEVYAELAKLTDAAD